MKHAIEYLKRNENYEPDSILQLRPTQPCRNVKDIDKCIELFIKHFDSYDSLRTVVEFKKSPYKMYTLENNTLKPLYKDLNGIKEPYNQCRQVLPTTYLHNGYIDLFKSSIIKHDTISGDKIFPYIMDNSNIIDIDTYDDWYRAENIVNNKYS